MAESIHDHRRSLDILVNNAGINIDRRFGDLTPGNWCRVIDINLNGAYYCTEVFCDDLLAADSGRVLTSSRA